jgi:hypothetical protein
MRASARNEELAKVCQQARPDRCGQYENHLANASGQL